jgi:hypothetical protein
VTQETPQTVRSVYLDIHRSPSGPRDRQLLYGQEVTVLGTDGIWSYIRAKRDDYLGYVKSSGLGPFERPTHTVTSPSTHAYESPDFKSRDLLGLCHLSHITALSETDEYVEIAHGFIPQKHLSVHGHVETDPATIAEFYLGTDYLWGGNTRWGIDCSGLVQAALLACGIPCPGDSDQQMSLGAPAHGPYQRNDLLFWQGHVALVCDADTLIHANAHTMRVNHEPIRQAITRIAASGDGPLTAHRRLPALSG